MLMVVSETSEGLTYTLLSKCLISWKKIEFSVPHYLCLDKFWKDQSFMWKKQRHRSSRNKKSILISEWKKSFSKAIENEEQTNTQKPKPQ